MTPEREKRYREILRAIHKEGDAQFLNAALIVIPAMHRAAEEARREALEEAARYYSAQIKMIVEHHIADVPLRVAEDVSCLSPNDIRQLASPENGEEPPPPKNVAEYQQRVDAALHPDPLDQPDDYADVTKLDWVNYEFATIEYDFKIHPEAARRITALFERLAKEKAGD